MSLCNSSLTRAFTEHAYSFAKLRTAAETDGNGACEQRYDRILALSDALSLAVGKAVGTKWSIFHREYAGVKARFAHRLACESARRATVKTMCEVGFQTGHSAMLLLESVPSARLVSFDNAAMGFARQCVTGRSCCCHASPAHRKECARSSRDARAS